MDFKKVYDIMQKCNICLGKAVISDEYIMDSFLKFLTATVLDENCSGRGIALHINSPCFMAIAVAWAAFSSILGTKTDVEQIVRSLRPGDPVIYNNKRGQFKGIENQDGIERVCIFQEGGIKRIGPLGWAKITPYYGESTRYDGRGIRRKTENREKFLAELLECNQNEIPRITDVSVIFVMDKHMAEYYMENIWIRYGKLEIKLAELATAAWFTEGKVYPLGVNAEKNEVMLKFTSKVSVAIDQTYVYGGNECLGIFICGNDVIERGITEIPSVMNRENIQFAFICGGMDLSHRKELILQYEDAAVYACTRDFLLKNTFFVKNKNEFTIELSRQTDTIINCEIEKIQVDGVIRWSEYKKFKNAVRLIRSDELDDVTRAEIVIPAYALMKFFMTTVVSVKGIEKAIADGKMQVYDPVAQIDTLKEMILLLPDNLSVPGEIITNTLDKLINGYRENSPKTECIRRFIRENRRNKKAIIVPKPNQVELIWSYLSKEYNRDALNLDIVSANRFDSSREYDKILVVGNMDWSRFDIFNCVSSSQIFILLYELECMMFDSMSRRNAEVNHLFNERQKIFEDLELENVCEDDTYCKEEMEEVFQEDEEVKKYSDEIFMIKFDNTMRHEYTEKNSPKSEVTQFVYFDDGEGAMLTKQYYAYVMNLDEKEVVQKRVELLKNGDNILFFNRDEDTRDIVDYILNIFIQRESTEQKVKEYYRKSRQWKEDLLDYMKWTKSTPREIAAKMLANGTKVQATSVMAWLDEDAHTVGPQKEESFYQIALLTGDEVMMSDPGAFHNACAVIRSIRKQILKELGNAIIRKLQGKEYVSEYIPAELYGRLDTMAVVLQIDKIVKVDRMIPSYMTNRPIDLEGGL